MPDEYERLRSRATLLAAEEGDPVLFSLSGDARKRPLQVTDTGGNDEEGYYLVAQGPRGGVNTIRERDEGHLSTDSGKRVTNLRFAEIGEAPSQEYQELRERALRRAQRMMADDEYDYSEWSAAALDAALDQAQTGDDAQQRAILLAGPDPDPDAYGTAPTDDDREALAYSALFNDIVEAGADYAGSSLTSSLDTKSDVDKLVDKGAVMARDYVEAGDELEEASEAAATILADQLTTSDHQAVIDFLPRPDAGLLSRLSPDIDLGSYVPWGDRESAYQQSVAYLAAAIAEEVKERREAEMIGDREVYSIEEFFDRFVGEDVDADEVGTMFDIPTLPMLSDGGMPHTTLDEATKIYLRDVPIIAGDWELLDGGLVTDDEQRQMAWGNQEEGEMVVMASVATEDKDANEWYVWALDLINDETTELYDGTSFDDAIDAVIDYIAPEEGRAGITFYNDENSVVVEENINEETLGDRALSGLGVVGDIAEDAFDVVAPVAERGGEVLGTAGISVGRATGRAASRVGGAFWRRYRRQVGEFIIATVGTALLHHGARVLAGGRFAPIVEEDRIGADFEYEKGATFVDREGNVAAQNWEAVEFDMDKGQYRLRNTENGEEAWVAPGEKEDTVKIRKTVNPYETGIANGTTLAWGVSYQEIADVFSEWGEDVLTMTLGQGAPGDSTWKPSPTGSVDRPDGSGGRSSRTSNPFRVPSGSSSDSSSSGSGGGSSSSDDDDGDDRAADPEATLDISEDEWERMWSVGNDLLEKDAKGLVDKLGVGKSPSEAAQEGGEDEKKPTTAEEIEDAVADADRADQLRHPNRSEEVDVSVTEDDVAPEDEDYEERKEDHREQKQEEAAEFFDAQDPDKQEDLADIHEEAERVREYEGEETTEDFDVESAVDRVAQYRREPGAARSPEEEHWQEEQQRRAEEEQEWIEKNMPEDEWEE